MLQRAPGPFGRRPNRRSLYAAPLDVLAFSGMQVDGGMQIAQENGATGVTVGPGTVTQKHITDTWSVYCNGTMVLSCQQDTDAPPGYTNSLKVMVSTADASIAAGDYTLIEHRIEGLRFARCKFGNAAAHPVTVGLWVKSSLTGTLPLAFSNSNASRTYLTKVTISQANTWEFKVVTIPGDVAGVWLTASGTGLTVRLTLVSGSDFNDSTPGWLSAQRFSDGTGTNFMGTGAATFQVTGVIVLPGIEVPEAGRAALAMRDAIRERLEVYRYYRRFALLNAIASNANYLVAAGFFTPAMRALPVVQQNAGGTSVLSSAAGNPTFTFTSFTLGVYDEQSFSNLVFTGLAPTTFTIGFMYLFTHAGFNARL